MPIEYRSNFKLQFVRTKTSHITCTFYVAAECSSFLFLSKDIPVSILVL